MRCAKFGVAVIIISLITIISLFIYHLIYTDYIFPKVVYTYIITK